MMRTTDFLQHAYLGVETCVYQVRVPTLGGEPRVYYELRWTDGPSIPAARAVLPPQANEGFERLTREISGPTRILGLVLIHAGLLPLLGENPTAGECSPSVLRTDPSPRLVRDTLRVWFEDLDMQDLKRGLSPDVLDRVEVLQVLVDGSEGGALSSLNLKESRADEVLQDEMELIDERWDDTLLFLSEEQRLRS